ncbi:DUF1028 domain-containing protein [Polymorphospora lycopeni]|uniref:DUF1028 domain-containing protein n=1 Tax=Polymorphospora lycopeni TaxID=3140240 RepID=A0ABV5CTW8_9ACTN
MTFSIVAVDPATGEIGAAVQSHFFAVGRRCLTVLPGTGAVASQAFGDAGHGPLVLDALSNPGAVPAVVLRRLMAGDENRELRQVMVIDPSGEAAAHTGAGCIPYAGHRIGAGVAAAGNTLSGPHWQDMVDAYRDSPGPIEQRLLAALSAAQTAGGDLRGMMSAALKVVGPERTRWPQPGTRMDLRVDHHPAPIEELARLVTLSAAHARLTAGVLSPGRIVGTGAAPIDDTNAPGILDDLAEAQHVFGDDPEPTFWRGVVAARVGRDALAASCFARAIALHPSYEQLAGALERAGRLRLPPGGLRALLAAHPDVPPPTTVQPGRNGQMETPST